MKQSLGLVEVRGMTAAITVADTMCKTANVQIHQLEKTKGGGWMLVMILGDVQAVQVAVDAGAAIAKSMNCYVGQTVIARLSDGLLDSFSPVVKELVEEVMSETPEVPEVLEVTEQPDVATETISVVEQEPVLPVTEEVVATVEQDLVTDNLVTDNLVEAAEPLVSDEEEVLVTQDETAVVDHVVVEPESSPKAGRSEGKRPKKSKKSKRK